MRIAYKFLLSTVILVILSQDADGQQLPVFSQYMFNGLAINPAYAGTHNVLSATISYRNQWRKFEGAPVNQSLLLHTPLKDSRVGVGMILQNDKIGIFQRTELYGSYAYHLRDILNGSLSFGLEAGFGVSNADFSELNLEDTDDPIFLRGKTIVKPNAGAGIYYKTRRFFLGASVPKLINTKLNYSQEDVLGFTAKERRHTFITTGYLFDVAANLKIRPSLLTRLVWGAPATTDFNLNCLLYERFWIGGTYRTNQDIVIIIEYLITPQLRLGYAHDSSFGQIESLSDNAHEISISYDWNFKKSKIITPRYF